MTGEPAATRAERERLAELSALIRTEIEATGPMTFARFMELALYEPRLGYYRQAADRPTDAGDFLTAPETHPIFGRTLARQVEELWERLGAPDPFTVLEYGAGSGTLGLSVIDGIARHGSALRSAIRYEPVELNPHRLAELRRRFEAAGLADRLDTPGRDDAPIVGLVLANEFLDALPVHRVVGRDGRLCELFVAWHDGFVEEPGEPSTMALAERLADESIALEDGQQAEICLAVGPWLDEVGTRLERGFVLVVDYGYPAAELYAPSRRGGTLLAYAAHRVFGNPLEEAGGRDLTAHVDFDAVRRLAADRGFSVEGLTTQTEFLVAAGLGEELRELQSSDATTFEDYARARSAIVRMLDPRVMGRFRVLLLGRGIEANGAPFETFAPRG